MKRSAFLLIVFSAATLLLAACARDEVVAESSGFRSTAPVAGEKIGGDSRIAPGAGPGGANANVRW